MTCMRQIDRMTLAEFRLRLTASALREIDTQHNLSYLAWQVREIEAKKKSGKKLKYVYNTFDKFFNYEKREAAITGGTGANTVKNTAAERYKEQLRKKACQNTA